MPHLGEMPLHPNQALLSVQSVEETRPKDCDARSFDDVMECLDCSKNEPKSSEVGCPARVMVKISGCAYRR